MAPYLDNITSQSESAKQQMTKDKIIQHIELDLESERERGE